MQLSISSSLYYFHLQSATNIDNRVWYQTLPQMIIFWPIAVLHFSFGWQQFQRRVYLSKWYVIQLYQFFPISGVDFVVVWSGYRDRWVCKQQLKNTLPYDFYITIYRLPIPSTILALFPAMRAESGRRFSLASLADFVLTSNPYMVRVIVMNSSFVSRLFSVESAIFINVVTLGVQCR